MSSTNPHRNLTEALLGGRADHVHAYHTSAAFHHAVDQLAAWLPIWLEAMAVAGRQADEHHAQAAALAERQLFSGRFDPESGELRGEDGRVLFVVPEAYRDKVTVLRFPDPDQPNPEDPPT